MTNLLLGILLGATLVIFCMWLMERSEGVTDAELEAWLDWREEWARRRAVEEGLRGMGAEEVEMAGEKGNEECACNGECGWMKAKTNTRKQG